MSPRLQVSREPLSPCGTLRRSLPPLGTKKRGAFLPRVLIFQLQLQATSQQLLRSQLFGFAFLAHDFQRPFGFGIGL
jgi:hypothetical protein